MDQFHSLIKISNEGAINMNTPDKALYQYIKATNSHNFQNVNEVISDNAIYYFSDKVCSENEEIKIYFESAWDLVKDETYSISKINWIHISEVSAVCVYYYNFTGFVDGKFVEGNGKATNVFEKKGGKWYLLHEHLRFCCKVLNPLSNKVE